MLLNLWKNTETVLASHGKTWDDVLQVQASGEFFPLDAVKQAFQSTLYHDPSEVNGDEVAIDLVVVGDGWAMRWERGWVWMEVPKLAETEGKCPCSFSTLDECDETGCRFPSFGKRVRELETARPAGDAET